MGTMAERLSAPSHGRASRYVPLGTNLANLGGPQIGIGVSLNIDGDQALLHTLRTLPANLENKYVRAGVTKAARIVRAEARRRVPVETGLLKKSLDIKVKKYPSGNIVALIGPRTGLRTRVAWSNRQGTRWTRNQKRVKRLAILGRHTEYRDPVHYAHLVEYGTGELYAGEGKGGTTREAKGKVLFGRGRFWGKRVRGTRPKPFLRPAFHATQYQAMREIEKTIVQGLMREADRAAASRGASVVRAAAAAGAAL